MSDSGRTVSVNDPRFVGPKTNKRLDQVVEQLDRQGGRMAEAAQEAKNSRRRERILIAIALATLVAVVGVIVTAAS